MGWYMIQIEGMGAHHNPAKPDYDANVIAQECLDKLVAKGHYIDRARFIMKGQVDDLAKPLPPGKPSEMVDTGLPPGT